MRYVYVLRCADDSLYTGITTDLERRFMEHNHEERGAKYTRARRPVELIWSQECRDRSEASKREYEIKRMQRSDKLLLST